MSTGDRRERAIAAVGRRWAAVCAFAAVLANAVPLFAQGAIFRWVDRQGNLHLSDELADVPEPYRSMYEAQRREAAEAKKHAPPAPASPPPDPAVSPPELPPSPSIIDEEAARRQRWKEQVASWRAELAAATNALADVDARLDELAVNPLMAQTPLVAADIVQARQSRAAALSRLEKARRMLLTELPARARREGVPPAWLM
jgi:hypothetical protein